MSQDYGSRKPLHLQEGFNKAKVNPSYESFRPNNIHPQGEYKEMEGRPSVHDMSRMRRSPDGTLDLDWAVNVILDAVHEAEYNGVLTSLQQSLLTVLFPVKFRFQEPQLAEIRTQLSGSEKSKLADLVEARLKQESSWNAGMGGGPGVGTRSNVGG